MSGIDFLADRQAVWSATANAMKARLDRTRRITLFLYVGGALAAALATQSATFIDPSHSASLRTWLTALGAVALAIAAFVTARFLSKDAINGHARARMASEALKREAYLFTTGSGSYRDATDPNGALAAAQSLIEDSVDNLTVLETQASSKGSAPRAPLTLDQYSQKRVDGQIAYYESKAATYAQSSKFWHTAEWTMALLAAIVTAIAGTIPGGGFDFAAITAVLTTIGGAVISHLQVSRFDELTASYRGTARRLRQKKVELPGADTNHQFVEACEDIIATETQSWLSMWTK